VGTACVSSPSGQGDATRAFVISGRSEAESRGPMPYPSGGAPAVQKSGGAGVLPGRSGMGPRVKPGDDEGGWPRRRRLSFVTPGRRPRGH